MIFICCRECEGWPLTSGPIRSILSKFHDRSAEKFDGGSAGRACIRRPLAASGPAMACTVCFAGICYIQALLVICVKPVFPVACGEKTD